MSTQPPAKAARTEQPVPAAPPAQPPGAPVVVSQAVYAPPVSMPHTAYHNQAYAQQVSTVTVQRSKKTGCIFGLI